MWPVWSNDNTEGTTCRIGDDKSGYFAFHCGGNFNIGCNANTTIVGYMSTWEPAACITESYELRFHLGQVLYNYHLDTYKISVALLSYWSVGIWASHCWFGMKFCMWLLWQMVCDFMHYEGVMIRIIRTLFYIQLSYSFDSQRVLWC